MTVATTEPVADYMLQAAGVDNLTPFSMQADIMNGTDPAPQAVSLQNALFSSHRVKAFIYNQQVTDSVTQEFLKHAHAAGIPVVGVYETMPTPGYDYQSWMMAELQALQRAVARREVDDEAVSTTTEPRTPPRARARRSCRSRGVGARLGGRPVLTEIDFSIAAGEFTGLIGANGAGKTTLFKVILGTTAPPVGRCSSAARHAAGATR